MLFKTLTTLALGLVATASAQVGQTEVNPLIETKSPSRPRRLTEYKNGRQLTEAAVEFHAILTGDPKFGPAYCYGGQTLEQLNPLDEAGAMYAAGIEARRAGRTHPSCLPHASAEDCIAHNSTRGCS